VTSDQAGAAAAELISVPMGAGELHGDLESPPGPKGLVIFVHGSGSSRHSPRNKFVAHALQQHGFATLLIDLLTEREEAIDRHTAHLRFDIEMLAARMASVVSWLRRRPELTPLPFGLFGASTGGGAALVVAAAHPNEIAAVVSRGGRPDLAGDSLPRVTAPTLLIVGGWDGQVVELNREAMARMRGRVVLEIVPGATHLFEEPGTLESVAELAGGWFERYLRARSPGE
jgi:putative phosphoribosyl transferase